MFLHYFTHSLLYTLLSTLPCQLQFLVVVATMKRLLGPRLLVLHRSYVNGKLPRKERKVHYLYLMPHSKSMTIPSQIKEKLSVWKISILGHKNSEGLFPVDSLSSCEHSKGSSSASHYCLILSSSMKLFINQRDHNVPGLEKLKRTMSAFKTSLQITPEEARDIERNTREQSLSPLWYAVRKHRITASLFGSVLSRKTDTPPDCLVLRVIQPKNFSTPATRYGRECEELAVKEYVSYQRSHGHSDIMVTASGVIINPDYFFLGASPDGAVYDPSNPEQPYGFLEVKCPYTVRNQSPSEACATSGFFLHTGGKWGA